MCHNHSQDEQSHGDHEREQDHRQEQEQKVLGERCTDQLVDEDKQCKEEQLTEQSQQVECSQRDMQENCPESEDSLHEDLHGEHDMPEERCNSHQEEFEDQMWSGTDQQTEVHQQKPDLVCDQEVGQDQVQGQNERLHEEQDNKQDVEQDGEQDMDPGLKENLDLDSKPNLKQNRDQDPGQQEQDQDQHVNSKRAHINAYQDEHTQDPQGQEGDRHEQHQQHHLQQPPCRAAG